MCLNGIYVSLGYKIKRSNMMLSYLAKRNEFEAEDVKIIKRMRFPILFLMGTTIFPRGSNMRNKLLWSYLYN